MIYSAMSQEEYVDVGWVSPRAPSDKLSQAAAAVSDIIGRCSAAPSSTKEDDDIDIVLTSSPFTRLRYASPTQQPRRHRSTPTPTRGSKMEQRKRRAAHDSMKTCGEMAGAQQNSSNLIQSVLSLLDRQQPPRDEIPLQEQRIEETKSEINQDPDVLSNVHYVETALETTPTTSIARINVDPHQLLKDSFETVDVARLSMADATLAVDDDQWSDNDVFDDSFVVQATQGMLRTASTPINGLKRNASSPHAPVEKKNRRFIFEKAENVSATASSRNLRATRSGASSSPFRVQNRCSPVNSPCRGSWICRGVAACGNAALLQAASEKSVIERQPRTTNRKHDDVIEYTEKNSSVKTVVAASEESFGFDDSLAEPAILAIIDLVEIQATQQQSAQQIQQQTTELQPRQQIQQSVQHHQEQKIQHPPEQAPPVNSWQCEQQKLTLQMQYQIDKPQQHRSMLQPQGQQPQVNKQTPQAQHQQQSQAQLQQQLQVRKQQPHAQQKQHHPSLSVTMQNMAAHSEPLNKTVIRNSGCCIVPAKAKPLSKGAQRLTTRCHTADGISTEVGRNNDNDSSVSCSQPNNVTMSSQICDIAMTTKTDHTSPSQKYSPDEIERKRQEAQKRRLAFTAMKPR